MVADYLVDYSYLAGELKKNSTESRFFMGLKMLCDTVEFDNARLIADEQLQCLGPLKELYTTFDDTVYEEFKVVCNENGYIGELQSQMWASVVKRVEKSTKE